MSIFDKVLSTFSKGRKYFVVYEKKKRKVIEEIDLHLKNLKEKVSYEGVDNKVYINKTINLQNHSKKKKKKGLPLR